MRSITPDDCAFVRYLLVDAGILALSLLDKNVHTLKSCHDLVSHADIQVQDEIVIRLRQQFPADGIVAEEKGVDIKGTSGRIWIIDPIDGTTNCLLGCSNWGISIGCFDNVAKKPLFGAVNFPALKEVVIGGTDIDCTINDMPVVKIKPPYLGFPVVVLGLGPPEKTAEAAALFKTAREKHRWITREFGCCVYGLLEVLKGNAHGYYSIGESSWDVMGMLSIIEASGGHCDVKWAEVGLKEKFRFTCGAREFVDLVASLKDANGNI